MVGNPKPYEKMTDDEQTNARAIANARIQALIAAKAQLLHIAVDAAEAGDTDLEEQCHRDAENLEREKMLAEDQRTAMVEGGVNVSPPNATEVAQVQAAVSAVRNLNNNALMFNAVLTTVHAATTTALGILKPTAADTGLPVTGGTAATGGGATAPAGGGAAAPAAGGGKDR